MKYENSVTHNRSLKNMSNLQNTRLKPVNLDIIVFRQHDQTGKKNKSDFDVKRTV